MPYNSVINRTDADALIPVEETREIFTAASGGSAIMQLAKRLPDMSAKQRRLKLVNSLPEAYFVNGDTGYKQTTKQAWENKYIEAEEIAVVVPIPEAVLEDADYDIWAQIRPDLSSAIAKAFDAAVLYGTNAPATWPGGVVPGATAAGNAVALGTNADHYQDLLGVDGLISKVEEDGYMVSGHVGAMKARAMLRGIADSTGQPVFRQMLGMQPGTQYELDGSSIVFPRNGAIDETKSLLISGDWSQLVFAVRQDITFKVFTEGVITDNTGAVIYNLMMQDMAALRVVFRAGWQLPNPINHINDNTATRYPFAVLTP